ncbi:MAG: Wzz/FepE/Etk N-terminal domain-containing protein, partial [bacterium]
MPEAPIARSSSTPQATDVFVLWRGLRHSWKLLVLVAGAVVCAAMALTLFQPYEYSADAQLIVKNNKSLGDFGNMAAQIAPGLMPQSSGGINILTEVEVISSRSILGRVVDEQVLTVMVDDVARERTLWRRVVEKVGVVTGMKQAPPAEDLQSRGRPITFANATIPPALLKSKWTLTRTGDTGYTVYDSKANASLGSGTIGTPFAAKGIEWTITGITGEVGDPYKLTFRSRESAIKDLQAEVGAARTKDRAELMRVTYSNTSPVMAKTIVDAVCDTYLAQSAKWDSELAQEIDGFLSGQIQTAENDLLAAQTKLNSYRAAKQTVLLSDEAKGLIAQVSEARVALATQQIDTQQLRFAYDRLKQADAQDFLVFISGGSAAVPIEASMVEDLSQLIAQRNGMLATRTASHPEVQSLSAQIATKEQAILDLVGQELQSASQRQGLIQGQVNALDAERMKIPQTETELASLTGEVQLDTQLLAAIKTKRQTNELAQGTQAQVRVLDYAIAPLRQSKPRWAISLMLSGLVGLALGLVLVVSKELLDTSIRRRDQAEELGIPVVAEIPSFQEHLPRQALAGQRFFLALRLDPLGPVAESFRILRAATNQIVGQSQSRVLGLTSAGTSEGKTLVTLNLAAMFAQAGLRTLVIDT